jgi:ribosomal protein L21
MYAIIQTGSKHKYKKRKNYHKKKGHRQKYLKVKINKIELK